MLAFRRAGIGNIISQLGLDKSNQAFADYWLSLWDGDALPPRSKFNPAKMKPFLQSMLVFDVVPDERVTVRLAGTGYRYILKSDPTGRDWIADAPEGHRATRLKLFSAVARGAVVVAHRRIAMLGGGEHLSEEVLLPFAEDPSGYVPVLVHVNFRPDQFTKVRSIAQVTGDPLDYKLVRLDGSACVFN